MIALGVHPRMARWLRSWQDSDPGEDWVGPDRRRPRTPLGPRPAPSSPVAIRATSDGGDFVQYSGTSSPAPAHEPPPEPPSILLAEPREDRGRGEPTVRIGRRRRRCEFDWMFRRR